MTYRTKLFIVSKQLAANFTRKYSKSIEKELEVPTFCDVYITVPYNLNIKPLNIHKYHNFDKLIIEHDGESDKDLEFSVNGNHVTIIDKTENTSINCNVKVPIKANLYVDCKRDITVGQLNGDKISLKSEEGNITLDKFHGESVKISTKTGDIKFKNVVQASNIEAVVSETGSIKIGRVQGLNLKLKTNNGDMTVESSYCNKSVFEVQKGKMELANIHKTCKIMLNEGHLKLNGFDGKLSTHIENGSADIYLSRILDNSDITIVKGTLHLTLAELCQKHVKYVVAAKECDFADDLNIETDENGCVRINPDINEHTVSVYCSEGTVIVDCASWKDMIKMKLKK